MVNTGTKSSELSIKHLAKTFYFVLSFLFLKTNQKIWRTWLKALNFRLNTKTRINYSHYCGAFLFNIYYFFSNI